MAHRRFLFMAASVLAALPAVAQANDYTWSGSADDLWSNSGNWSPGGVPGAGDTVTFSGSKSTAVQLDGDRGIESVTFGSGAGAAFTINGNTLTLGDGGTIAKAAAGGGAYKDAISSNVVLAGAATFANNDGNDIGGRLLSFKGSISGSGTLHVSGTGSGVELAGDNSGFTGAIQMDSGLLLVTNAKALGSSSAATTVNGGQVWFNSAGSTSENWIIAGNTEWRSYSGHTQSGNISVNEGATWTIQNGDGNYLGLPGVISGKGNIHFTAANTEFKGSTSNTLSGKITLAPDYSTAAYNTLTLNKTGGATAIAGDLEVSKSGIVLWGQNNQIADTSVIILGGGTLRPNGHSDSLGELTVTGRANIDLSGGANLLRFADSHGTTWTAGGQLILRDWSGSGTDGVFVGSNSTGLTADQVGKIGFINPAGREAGLYRATLGANGELTPNTTAVQAINPPFDLSAAAQAQRAKLYTSDGLSKLSGKGTPLHAGEKISIFGDSITWLNGYVSGIQNGLANGEGTAGKGIEVFNRGINGAGVSQLLNGSATNTFNGQPQASFADVIAADHSNVAVVFIGINDVHFLGTSASDYEQGLRALATAAAANHTKLVLATPTVFMEKPDGSNPDDAKIDAFSKIVSKVAKDTGSTLVDLRSAYIAYLQNNNYELQLDGSLTYQDKGILTYDGIHPTALGNDLLSNLISQGIYNATVPEPTSMLLLPGGLLLGMRTRPHRS